MKVLSVLWDELWLYLRFCVSFDVTITSSIYVTSPRLRDNAACVVMGDKNTN